MKRYILIRVLKALLCLWFIITVVFFLTRLTGDPTYWMVTPDTPEFVREEMRESMGLNKPILEQYLDTLCSLFNGQMGKSYYYKRPVSELFAERAAATVMLGATALGLAIIIGIPLGVLAAVKRNSFIDRLSMVFSVAGFSVPNFVFGILLILLFSLRLRLLPSSGYGTFRHLILPALTLSMEPMATIARLTRSSMLDTLRQDYLDCSRAKGLKEIVVVFKHALRNSLIPVVTAIGTQMGTILGGTVAVETVFGWPGIGSLLIPAVQNRDFPVIQFGVMIIAIAITATNTLVDFSYAYLDPRIRNEA